MLFFIHAKHRFHSSTGEAIYTCQFSVRIGGALIVAATDIQLTDITAAAVLDINITGSSVSYSASYLRFSSVSLNFT